MRVDFRPQETAGVRSLSRGLQILELFAPDHASWTVSQIAARLDLPLASTHRLVSTLMSSGFLERDRARGPLRLGLRLVHLGFTVLAGLDLREIARARMDQLVGDTEETVVLLVPGPTAAVCVEHIDGTFPIRPASLAVGEHRPYNAGAVGLALLAFLPNERRETLIRNGLPAITERTLVDPDVVRERCAQIRRSGVSFSEGEVIPGTAALAAPIFGPGREIRAVIAITGIAERFRGKRRGTLEGAVRASADEISRRIGGPWPPEAR